MRKFLIVLLLLLLCGCRVNTDNTSSHETQEYSPKDTVAVTPELVSENQENNEYPRKDDELQEDLTNQGHVDELLDTKENDDSLPHETERPTSVSKVVPVTPNPTETPKPRKSAVEATTGPAKPLQGSDNSASASWHDGTDEGEWDPER